jgi:hypothetical protein
MAFKLDELSEDRLLERLNWFGIAAILIATQWLQDRWLTPNVHTLPLCRCVVDWHANGNVLAVTCAGHDMIKVAVA